jgi:hypothetical protein
MIVRPTKPEMSSGYIMKPPFKMNSRPPIKHFIVKIPPVPRVGDSTHQLNAAHE